MNLADALNLHCACGTLAPAALAAQLDQAAQIPGLAAALARSHPHLFSSTVLFLDPAQQQAIEQTVAAIERVARLPAWQAAALARAPDVARLEHGPTGVFMGYDFHLGASGPQLIEVNTNAGGALLNLALARAPRDCCPATGWLSDAGQPAPGLDSALVDMFRAEWSAQRGDAPWRTVVIADDEPMAQYLAPEFELARHLFQRHGLQAAIGDARAFRHAQGRLWHPALGDAPVDLVYNRLTDFYLQAPEHAALREAYAAGDVVLTPHPRAHALLADKRHLIALSDPAQLLARGAAAADAELIARHVPRTQAVDPAQADALWAARRTLFFKPARGYGARAAYRGDKLTRGVWQAILAQADDYVAQTLAPPSERLVRVDGVPTRLKADVRAYSWRGRVQLFAARTWSGQTTNFRTAGGGFAPVVLLPDVLFQPFPSSLPQLSFKELSCLTK